MEASLASGDIKTQRRMEANRESARRSKQRQKAESDVLGTRAQELVRERVAICTALVGQCRLTPG